jgi:hypothetical protein
MKCWICIVTFILLQYWRTTSCFSTMESCAMLGILGDAKIKLDTVLVFNFTVQHKSKVQKHNMLFFLTFINSANRNGLSQAVSRTDVNWRSAGVYMHSGLTATRSIHWASWALQPTQHAECRTIAVQIGRASPGEGWVTGLGLCSLTVTQYKFRLVWARAHTSLHYTTVLRGTTREPDAGPDSRISQEVVQVQKIVI